MPVVRKTTEEVVKRGRGRPKGSKNGTSSAKRPIVEVIATEKRVGKRGRPTAAEAETIYIYKAAKCGCTMRSGVNPNNPYFMMQCKHGNAMEYSATKKGA